MGDRYEGLDTVIAYMPWVEVLFAGGYEPAAEGTAWRVNDVEKLREYLHRGIIRYFIPIKDEKRRPFLRGRPDFMATI